jgi:hypothetical protein
MGRLIKESDPRARLRRGAESVLRHAVEARQLGTDGHQSVHRSLRSLCRVARTQNIHAEQLVLICKDAWRTLPQARQLPPETGRELLTGVIARCIDEFYQTDRAALDHGQRSESAAVPASSLSFMLGPLS